jgi:hypothetical protein
MVVQASVDIGPFMARTAAANLYVQCFPLVLADAVRRSHRQGAHQFQILSEDGAALAPGLAEDDPLIIVSSAWMDLSNEPAVLRLPHTRGRYINATLMDSAGEPFASLGARTGDDAGADLALVGPRWRGELPAGVKAKRAPSEQVWVVCRLRAHSSLDLGEALATARRVCVASLSRRPDPLPAALSTPEPRPWSCLRQIEELAPAAFFDRLDAILERAPASFHQSVLPRIAAIRRELGGPPKSSTWSPEFEQALAVGLEEGAAAVRSAAGSLMASGEAEWRTSPSAGSSSAIDALTRAARAYSGMGAPLRDDQLTLICGHDDKGRPLSGAQAYRIHFSRGGLPPVDAFWRLSTRPAESSAQRPGLGSRSDLALNPDGSLDIFLQHEPPSPERMSNWLQTPRAAWSLVLRLYCPQTVAFGGLWRSPSLQRLEPGSGSDRPQRSGATVLQLPLRASFGLRSNLGT